MPNCRTPHTATPEKAWCVTAGSDRRRRTGKADDDADRWEEQIAVARPTASRSSWPGRSAKRVFALDVPAIHVLASPYARRGCPGQAGHDGDSEIQRLVAAKDAVFVEGDAAIAGEIGLDVRPRRDAVVQIDQAGYPALEGFHAFGKCIAQPFHDLEQR